LQSLLCAQDTGDLFVGAETGGGTEATEIWHVDDDGIPANIVLTVSPTEAFHKLEYCPVTRSLVLFERDGTTRMHLVSNVMAGVDAPIATADARVGIPFINAGEELDYEVEDVYRVRSTGCILVLLTNRITGEFRVRLLNTGISASGLVGSLTYTEFNPTVPLLNDVGLFPTAICASEDNHEIFVAYPTTQDRTVAAHLKEFGSSPGRIENTQTFDLQSVRSMEYWADAPAPAPMFAVGEENLNGFNFSCHEGSVPDVDYYGSISVELVQVRNSVVLTGFQKDVVVLANRDASWELRRPTAQCPSFLNNLLTGQIGQAVGFTQVYDDQRYGCACKASDFELPRFTSLAPPVGGANWSVRVTGPVGASGALVAGLSSTDWLAPGQLSFDVTPFGAPGSILLQDGAISMPFTIGTAGCPIGEDGCANLLLSVPAHLANRRIFVQVYLTDPGLPNVTNTLELVTGSGFSTVVQ